MEPPCPADRALDARVSCPAGFRGAPRGPGLALPAGAGGPAALRGVGTPRTGAGGPAARRCLIRAMRTEAGAIRSAAWKADSPLAMSLPLFEETRVASPGFAAVRRSASFICFWELNREGNSGGRRTGRRPLSALAGTGVPRSGPSLVARPGRAAQRPAPRPALEARGSLVPGPVWPQRRRCLGAAEGQGGDPRGAGASGASASPSLPGRGRAGRDLCAASWARGRLLVQGTRREPSAAGALPSPPRPPRSGEPRQVKPLRPHPGSGSALGNGDLVHVTTHPCGHASGGRVQVAGWVTLPAPQQERRASWSPAPRRREGRALQGALRADGPARPARIVRAHRRRGRAGWALVSRARPGRGKEGGQGAAPGQGNTAQARQTRGGQWPLCWAPLWGATCQPAEADDRVTAGDEGNAEVASAPRTRAEERAALRPLEVTGSRACEAGRRGLLRAPERVRLGDETERRASWARVGWAPPRAASPTETEGPAQPDVHPAPSSAGRHLRLIGWNQVTCPKTDPVARDGDRRGTEPGGTRVKSCQAGPSLTPEVCGLRDSAATGRVTSPSDCRHRAQCQPAGPTCPWM